MRPVAVVALLVALALAVVASASCTGGSEPAAARATRLPTRPRPAVAASAAASAASASPSTVEAAEAPADPEPPDPRFELVRKCAALAIGDGAAPGPVGIVRRAACEKLGPELATLAGALRARCDALERDACSVLAAALVGYKTAALATELFSPPCGKKKTDAVCQARVRRIERIELEALARDDAGAARLFERDCASKDARACVELAFLATKGVREHELMRTACLLGEASACPDAVYGAWTVPQLADPELHGRAAETLAARCDAGGAVACNALGFLLERGLVAPGGAESAAAYYRKACDAGRGVGCANLVFLALARPALAHDLELRAIVPRLALPCDRGEQHVCLARALALARGLGVRAKPAEARKELAALCQAGLSEACPWR
jgi:TPR repeat protein